VKEQAMGVWVAELVWQLALMVLVMVLLLLLLVIL
jgi:hypothetical protein